MEYKQLCTTAKKLGCTVLFDQKLKDYSTFRVGGVCPVLIKIVSENALCELVRFCEENNIRHIVLGKGSNVLFDDNGYDGAVFLMDNDYSQITLLDEITLKAQAGCSLMKLCRFALDNSLSGLEFAYGIPGTVGGAVFMNAGAYGGEIKNVIVSANAVSADGEGKTFSADDMQLSYRHSAFQTNGYIVSDAVFKLAKGDKSDIQAKMNELMGKRREKQPLEFPNAGSTFKRPEGQFAGKLIQDCGLRGYTVGGAQISEKHCGFVINKGNATAADIKQVIADVQKIVKEKTGYFLECEVRLIPCSNNIND